MLSHIYTNICIYLKEIFMFIDDGDTDNEDNNCILQ